MTLEKEKRLKKVIDFLAGSSSWIIIIVLLILARYYPIVVSAIVTFYVIYWVYQSLAISRHSIKSLKEIQKTKNTNWLKKLKKEFNPEYKKIYQAILIPFANEGFDILDQTVSKVAETNFPKKQKILALAPENKIPKGLEIAKKIKEKYQDKFFKIYIFPHTLVEGEIVGKASNQNNGARNLYKTLVKEKINPKNVVLTSLDSDMLVDKEYLSLLTYKFLKAGKDRFNRIFQPVPMNITGMWETAVPASMVAGFGLQWFLSLVHRHFDFINFAVYACSLESVHNAGYWPPDIIPEDERFYWQMYFYTKGKLEVVPLFVPVYGSVIITEGYIKTLKAQYDQIRRWAWGVSETSFVVINMLKDSEIPWLDKLIRLTNKIRKNVEWVLLPVILGVGNRIPEWLNETYKQSTLSFNIPTLTSRLLTITLFTFLVLFFILKKTAPKKPKQWKKYYALYYYPQWVLFPLVSVFFGSIPALDAQTRLMFGKTIYYKTAPKTA